MVVSMKTQEPTRFFIFDLYVKPINHVRTTKIMFHHDCVGRKLTYNNDEATTRVGMRHERAIRPDSAWKLGK